MDLIQKDITSDHAWKPWTCWLEYSRFKSALNAHHHHPFSWID